jgi:arylsulfatase A-like enzyme
LATGGREVATPVELLDLFPTLAGAAGLEVPPEVQGMDLGPALRGEAWSARRSVFAESGAVKMLRREDHKLVHYPGQPYGELYDLRDDPDECRNLWDFPDHRLIRDQLERELLERLIAMEAPLHGPSRKGPAYWRQSYHLPFTDQ